MLKSFTKFYLLFAAVMVFSATAFSQKAWEKPFDTWSKDDAMKVAWDSPWVLTYRSMATSASDQQKLLARDQRDTVNRGGNGSNAGSTDRSTQLPVVFRLHSGLPVRLATVRMKQLANGYDKMSGDDKKKFDVANSGFLACSVCKDYYVISIARLTDTSGQTVEEPIFQRSSLNDLKGNVWLVNDKGEKTEIFQFTPPKNSTDSAYFFFSRKNEKGEPFLPAGSKAVKLLFNNNFFLSTNPYAKMLPQTLEFDLKKIVIADQIVF